MAKLKVPSLQHLARIWRSDPDQVRKELVKLVANSPPFSYEPIFKLVRDMLVFGQPYDDLVECVRRKEKREKVRENFLEILALVRNHFDGVSPTFVQEVHGRLYPIGRGLMVPFKPPLVYGVGGKVIFPWFIFWRSNPLDEERLSLFVTLVDELLLQDPDLEDAKFEILDFSCPGPGSPRQLTIVDANEIPRVAEDKKNKMLEIFAEGYIRAESELAARKEKGHDKNPPLHDSNQTDLF